MEERTTPHESVHDDRESTGGELAPITRLHVGAYTIPTDRPESDGTLAWDSTTVVVVEAHAGGVIGLGYGYADTATAELIRGTLAAAVRGRDAGSVTGAWTAMVHAVRNLGGPGIAAMAISAVDLALWDLKARLLDMPLAILLDAPHERVPLYGSGGFTSYTIVELREQLAGWVHEGQIPRVKMKVGREPVRDVQRVRAAREAIGDDAELYVDANGAYSRKQALWFAEAYAELGVSWFEEPVSSDDLDGLRLLRDRAPAGMAITAGEYGYDTGYFRRMLAAGAVDVLQADATRCRGITGFLRAGALCEAHHVELSGHTAPMFNVFACAAVVPLRHLEYFHDHVRIERLLFDGMLEPDEGTLRPDRARPGHGLTFRRADAERFQVFAAKGES